jgi:hypothetical protein
MVLLSSSGGSFESRGMGRMIGHGWWMRLRTRGCFDRRRLGRLGRRKGGWSSFWLKQLKAYSVIKIKSVLRLL